MTTLKIHKKIGGYKENLLMAEDVDYGKRAVAAGARYQYFFTPYVLHSSRRLRHMGSLRFVFLYIRSYFHTRKYGAIYAKDNFDYPFGHYEQ